MPRVRTCPLTSTQIRILQVLAKNPQGMTGTQLADEGGFGYGETMGASIGRKDVEEQDPSSLAGQGLVSIVPDLKGMREVTYYCITSKGLRTIRQYTVKQKMPREHKIPWHLLVPVIQDSRKRITYGLEEYTEADLLEIRSKLPERYHGVPPDSIRSQAVNLRKTGKLSTDKEQGGAGISLPEWYQRYRQVGDHFIELRERLLQETGGRCMINDAHVKGVDVWHKRFKVGPAVVLHQEREQDLLILCEGCRKRLLRGMVKIPDEQPE